MSLATAQNVLCVPTSQLALHEKKRCAKLKEAWKSELDSHLFEDFVLLGLLPFLKRKGYSIGVPVQHLIHRVEEMGFVMWRKVHETKKNQEITQGRSVHDGGVEEQEHQCQVIDVEEWADFLEDWAGTEWMDDSDAGLAQRAEFPLFLWKQLRLSASPAHLDWLAIQEALDGEDEQEAVEDRADTGQGGDRRTL